MSGGESKVRCCKEQYCTGTRNGRAKNQGKLKVIKQEMARVNIDILGISELKWTGIGKFNSDDHYIYYCGKESYKRNGVALIVNKRVSAISWVQSQKWQNDLCFFLRQIIQYHNNPSLCLNHWCWRSWSWMVPWKTIRPSRTNTQKDVVFVIEDWDAEVWSQEIPGVTGKFGLRTKWSREKSNRVFLRDALVIANTLFQ